MTSIVRKPRPPRSTPPSSQPATAEKTATSVFDKGRSQTPNGAVRAGLASTAGGQGFSFTCRRDAKDNVPARGNSTAQLMGDPRPDQFNHKPLWSYE